MLEVQNYLRSGKTLDELNTELGIVACKHPHLPLVILNYNQINSPKTNPIVRECRGLVLHSDTYDLVARGFCRFFNWGEVQEEMKNFDFSDFIVQEKVDGSLSIIYYHNNSWHINTRGSFALDVMQCQSFTWREAMLKAMNLSSVDELDQHLDHKHTYVCEFVSPYNKVVRRYEQSKIYLLTAFEGHRELNHVELDEHYPSVRHLFDRPEVYEFHSIEEIQDFLKECAEKDPTFEGVVIRDKNNNRYKVKSATYLSLHRMSGNGNLFNPKYLLPFVLTGEKDELFTYFSEVKEKYYEVEAKVNDSYNELLYVWKNSWQIESQKDFALAIIKKTPFSGLLFQLRKENGINQTEKLLDKMWRDSEDLIVKILFKN